MTKSKRKRELHHVLDEHLCVIRWPSQAGLRLAVLAYLATKLEAERRYSEPAINAVLRRWTAFNDPALLRRELFERGLVDRTRDGSAYWRVEAATAAAEG